MTGKMHGHEAAVGRSSHEDCSRIAVVMRDYLGNDLTEEANVVSRGRLAAQYGAAPVVPMLVNGVGSDDDEAFLLPKRRQTGLPPHLLGVLRPAVEEDHNRMHSRAFNRLDKVITANTVNCNCDPSGRAPASLCWKFRATRTHSHPPTQALCIRAQTDKGQREYDQHRIANPTNRHLHDLPFAASVTSESLWRSNRRRYCRRRTVQYPEFSVTSRNLLTRSESRSSSIAQGPRRDTGQLQLRIRC
jgi:hypothetical protein